VEAVVAAARGNESFKEEEDDGEDDGGKMGGMALVVAATGPIMEYVMLSMRTSAVSEPTLSPRTWYTQSPVKVSAGLSQFV